MANFVKKELAKKLAIFFKDMNPDRVSLSFFSGKGELTNLELKEDFLQETLDFPPWLQLRKASCSSVRCNLSWTKLKSQPVKIIIDNMQVVLQATNDFLTRPTTQDKATAAAAAAAAAASAAKKEKYGMSDSIVDGMTVEINYITVTFIGDVFDGTIDISGLCLKSTNHMWQVADLSQSVIKDGRTNSIYVYKELSIESLRLAIYPNSSRIHPDAKRDPVTFELNDPHLRIIRQRSLNDNTLTLSVQMLFLLDELKLELSKYQIQTLLLMFESMSTLHGAGKKVQREMKRQQQLANPDKDKPKPPPQPTGDATAQQQQPATFGLQFKINHGLFALREPLKHYKDTVRQYLTSVTLRKLIMQHYPERDFGFYTYSHSLSSSLFGSQFLEERQVYMAAVGGAVVKELDHEKVLKQSNTFFSCSNILFKSETDHIAPDSTSPSTAAIIHSNYHKFHLPSDTPIILLEHCEYFIAPQAHIRFHDQKKYPLPPPLLFARLHPIKIELHQGALIKLIRFAEHCKLEPLPNAPTAASRATSSSSLAAPESPVKQEPLSKVEELTIMMMSAMSVGELQQVAEVIKHAKADNSLTETELADLRAQYVKCMAALKDPEDQHARTRLGSATASSPAAAAAAQQAHTHMRHHVSTPEHPVFTRFLFEVLLPTIELPQLHEGPVRVKNQTMSVLASRISITNTPRATKFGFSNSDLDDFYHSTLHTRPNEFPRGQDSLTAVTPDLKLLSSPDRHYPDPQRLLVVNVDQIWIESLDHRKKRNHILRPMGVRVFLVDASNPDIHKKSEEHEGEEDKAAPPESDKLVPSSFTLVKVSDPVDVTLTNSQLLFLMRNIDQYSKMDLLLDNGEPFSMVGVTFVAANSVTLNFLELPKKGERAPTAAATEDNAEAPPPLQPFTSVTLQKVQLVTHGVGREGNMALISDAIFVNLGDGTVSRQIGSHSPHRPQIALCTRTPNPSPVLSKEFYAAWETRMQHKRLLTQWQRREDKRKEHEAKEAKLAAARAKQLQHSQPHHLSSSSSSAMRPRSASEHFRKDPPGTHADGASVAPSLEVTVEEEPSNTGAADGVTDPSVPVTVEAVPVAPMRRSASQDMLGREDAVSVSSASLERGVASSDATSEVSRLDTQQHAQQQQRERLDSHASASMRTHRAASIAPSHASDGDNISLNSAMMDDSTSIIYHETNVDPDTVLLDFETVSMASDTLSNRVDGRGTGEDALHDPKDSMLEGHGRTEAELDEEEEEEEAAAAAAAAEVELIDAALDPKPVCEYVELPLMPCGSTQVRVQSISLDIKSSHTEKLGKFFEDYAEPMPSKAMVDVQVISSRISFLREETLLPIPEDERKSNVVVDSLYLKSDGSRTWTIGYQKEDERRGDSPSDAGLRDKLAELEAKLQFAEAALAASERDRHDLLKSLSEVQTDLSLTRQARAKLEEQLHPGQHRPAGDFAITM